MTQAHMVEDMAKRIKEGQGNPFRLVEMEISGMAPESDDRPFRFLETTSDFGQLISSPEFVETCAGKTANAYFIQKEWQPIATDDWRLGALIEWFADRGETTPTCLRSALAYALGVSAYALRRIAALEAVLLDALQQTKGPKRRVSDIAAEVDVKERTLYNWKALAEYGDLLERAKALFSRNAPIVFGAGALPYIGDEWLDPPGEAGWQFEVEQVAQEIIYRIRVEAKRTPSANLRRAAYTIVEWHASHGRPLSPTVVKAMAYALGQVNHARGDVKVRRTGVRKSQAILDVALEDAFAEAFGRDPPSERWLSKTTGASRPAITGWRRDSELYEARRKKVQSMLAAKLAR